MVDCRPSHVASDDPIVHSGRAGMSHAHQFFGNRTTSATSTLATLRSGGTSCSDLGDRAAYWLPTIRGKTWSDLRAYYSAGTIDQRLIETYPDGLQMIAGDATASRSSGVGVIAWSCGRAVDAPGWSAVPPSTCPGGGPLVVRVTFPQCWDGHGLRPDSVVPAARQRCPTSHSRALPLLRLRAEVSSGSGTLALASGPSATMHADFWNAWDPNRLAQLVRSCVRGERTSNTELKRCRVPGAGMFANESPITRPEWRCSCSASRMDAWPPDRGGDR